MSEYTKIVLKSGKDQSVKRLHPWIFSGAIKKIYGTPAEGDVVKVYNNKDEFLGMGHYQNGSIAIRILSFSERNIDEAFFRERIKHAYNYRKEAGIFTDVNDTNVYRLVHAEGDFLPGLIIDYYNGTAVIQCHSAGMHQSVDTIATVLSDLYGNHLHAIYDKSAGTLPKALAPAENKYLLKQKLQNQVQENGLSFEVDWEEGQKTGFYIDQRDNRQTLGLLSAGKKVLNLFGYTGGFSVYAGRAGASMVHTVDGSKKAIEIANRNMEFNCPDIPHEGFAEDAFDFLQNMDHSYQVIILDPPAFAKHHKVLSNAIQGYKKLNTKAIQKIAPGGILFTFSCSQVMSRENFKKMIFTSATHSGRKIRILKQLSQPADHPVNIYHPESEYLKGLVLYIE